MKKDDVVLLYVGDGSALPNVPARNLNRKDINNWQVSVKACIASGLYIEPASEKKAVKRGKDGEEWQQAA